MIKGPLKMRRATAQDVADLVGCSVATVSLVVNGKAAGRVNAETEERVLQAVHDLDYRINRTASALARRVPNTVAFVCPDPTNPFFSLVLEGVMSALGDGLTLTLVAPGGGDDYGPSTVRRAMDAELAGLILASPGQDILDSLTPDYPAIVLDAAGVQSGFLSINLDIASAATELADHLAGLGHRKLAYVGLDRNKATLLDRREALEVELARRGAQFAVPDVLVNHLTIDAARDASSRLWAQWRAAEVSAIICGDDLLAYGVMEAARLEGVAIPGEFSIASFNNVPYSAMVSPPLTSVDWSARELGVRAADALTRLLNNEQQPRISFTESRLVVRESTIAYRAR